MQRVFLEDCGNRYKRGMLRDWPMATWRGISNWERITMPLDGVLDQMTGDEPLQMPDGSTIMRLGSEIDPDRLPQTGGEGSPRRGPGRPPKHPRD
jgi:hypothetical protein